MTVRALVILAAVCFSATAARSGKRDRTGQPIDLADDERRTVQPRRGQRLIQRRPVRPLTGFDLGKLEAKPGFALAPGADPVVADEFSAVGGHGLRPIAPFRRVSQFSRLIPR